ncbi:phospholipase D-like domain-containing protein [Oryzifoliimicrobium ureilyticus]|uniref:phospholipase D-like domain-containing protein n=1 Tax=Oryzifoliimicrobium ureilyticus TaxID=3113724 RepID=UPI0030761669
MIPSDATAVPHTAARIPPAMAGSYPRRAGNMVRPLIDGVPAFRRIAEATSKAQHSIWLTLAFYAPDFRLPDSDEALFDMLDHAVERGLDVRVLCWRPNRQSEGDGRTFAGTPADFHLLGMRDAQFNIRWDEAPAAFCHHQKCWMIDAGHATETSFIGGINLTAKALGSPGHRDGGQHDLYVEIAGPSATDVHHNFVQRWNEASERNKPDGWWGPKAATTLAFPVKASDPAGPSLVQIQRMIPPGIYTNGHAAPNGLHHNISGGERSILEQYEQAIDAAQLTIYIENQAIPIPAIAHRLEAALRRGIEVALVVPANTDMPRDATERSPAEVELFSCLAALARYDNFALMGLAVLREHTAKAVYVHGKAMIVDDVWATIGSCNLHSYSLGRHTEMNASIWDAAIAKSLRCELFVEHLNEDTVTLNSRQALRRLRDVAVRNRAILKGLDGQWQGLIVSLNADDYGRSISM